jgi:hypothetical protein
MKIDPLFSLLGVILGWGLNSLSQYFSTRREDVKRYRIATFYVLRAYKSLMDYERGTRYFRQDQTTIDDFEPWRAILEVQFRDSLEVNADTTARAVETLASVDPPLAARIDNTIKNILSTFRKDLTALSKSDPETYVKLIYSQDRLVEMTLADFKTVALSLAARSGFRHKRKEIRWFSERQAGTKGFMDTMQEQHGLLQKVVAGDTPMSTVYIFGAGASKHVGYPLISEMGKEMLEWMMAYPNGRFRSAAEIVAERFGKRPNFEEVITYLESTIKSLTNSEVAEEKIFGNDFREQLRDLGIHEVLSTPRSPWQRAYVERVIGSIRRECLDHVIVFHESSLRRTLALYFDYDHRSRTHLSLGKDTPEPRPIQPPEIGSVVAGPQVGGLHHRYERRAA